MKLIIVIRNSFTIELIHFLSIYYKYIIIMLNNQIKTNSIMKRTKNQYIEGRKPFFNEIKIIIYFNIFNY